MKRAAIFSLSLLALVSRADLVPVKGQSDLRVRYADYKSDDVVVVAVALGVMTRVILNPDETIVKAEPGFPSNCERLGDEWCIKAEPGTNQIWVNPRTRATKNNLEISTTKRDYSLKFVVMPGQENAPTVYYRVIFRYALPPMPMKVAAKGSSDLSLEEALPDVQAQEFSEPIVRNANYSKQTAKDSDEIAPSVVFDDGRFTYFRYPKNREIPAIFAIGPAGEEIRVNTHSARLSADPENPKARVTNDYLVVQRLSKKFILRLGSAVVNVINEEFDASGIETWNGTTTPYLVRKHKVVEPK